MRSLKDKFEPAICGLKDLITTEGSIRLQVYITICALVGAYCIGFSYYEMLVVAVLCTIVISAECCNTVIEWMLNMVYPEYHPVCKKIKDGAAGLVLACSIMSFIIGMIMVLRHVM